MTYHAEGTPQKLSEWAVVQIDDGWLVPNDRVLPYDLNTALFTDYAHKFRTVWMPEGQSARPDGANAASSEHLEFPVGTILSKTFYYPTREGGASHEVLLTKASGRPEFANRLDLSEVRLLETRLLVRRPEGWITLPYVWNEEQSEATLEITGEVFRLDLVNEESGEVLPFPYLVPDMNQCSGCHASDHTAGKALPLGPKLRHLNRGFRLCGRCREPARALGEDGLPERRTRSCRSAAPGGVRRSDDRFAR